MTSNILKLCPKCGKSFMNKWNLNSNYDIYIHKRDTSGPPLTGLQEYCIVLIDHVYKVKEEPVKLTPLNPRYKPVTSKF